MSSSTKLFAVTLIRSRISRPHWQKRTLDALGLKKTKKTMIHKNTPSICGLLNTVKDLVDIKPITLRQLTDEEQGYVGFKNAGKLLDNGEFLFTKDDFSKEVKLYIVYI